MAKMHKATEIVAYAGVIGGLRERIVASQAAVDAIREEVQSGQRDPESNLEMAEVQHLKELRGALIIHLYSLNEMIGDE